jgi:anthranilate synthase component 2
MNLLMLDNYDSFTYNLVQLLKENPAHQVQVRRNNEIDLKEVAFYDAIFLSPGGGLPKEAGLLCPLIEKYAFHKPIFGVCLGMQAIAEVFGAKLLNLAAPLHGISTQILHQNTPLFKGLPTSFQVGRYHSWAIDKTTLSTDFMISATDLNQIPMAIEHQSLPLAAVQFHPESILTEFGRELIDNFLNQIVPLKKEPRDTIFQQILSH